jgi:hypothetical protein
MPLASEMLVCSQCSSPIPAEDWNREHAYCRACRAPLTVLVFPAFFPKDASPALNTALLEEGEASCFYHPKKRAVVPCDQCGRFLCSLCQVEFLGQNWCPGCIEIRRQKGQLAALDARRPLYDNMVLALAVLPSPLMWPTIITAPMSLYLTAKFWRAPSSILPRTKIRFWIAALLAFLQIAGWTWLVLYLIYKR